MFDKLRILLNEHERLDSEINDKTAAIDNMIAEIERLQDTVELFKDDVVSASTALSEKEEEIKGLLDAKGNKNIIRKGS